MHALWPYRAQTAHHTRAPPLHVQPLHNPPRRSPFRARGAPTHHAQHRAGQEPAGRARRANVDARAHEVAQQHQVARMHAGAHAPRRLRAQQAQPAGARVSAARAAAPHQAATPALGSWWTDRAWRGLLRGFTQSHSPRVKCARRCASVCCMRERAPALSIRPPARDLPCLSLMPKTPSVPECTLLDTDQAAGAPFGAPAGPPSSSRRRGRAAERAAKRARGAERRTGGARGATRSERVDDRMVPGLRGVQQRAAAQAVARARVRARAQQQLHHVCVLRGLG